MTDLAERLKAKQRPRLDYRLLVDADGAERARTELADAEQGWRQARTRGETGKGHKVAEARVEKARTSLDACFATVTFRALPPTDYEMLRALHPPTKDQQDKGDLVNTDTFRPALVAACADGGMTEEQWRVFLDEQCSDGERHGLYLAALRVNEAERVADALVPKDWMREMLSSLSSSTSPPTTASRTPSS